MATNSDSTRAEEIEALTAIYGDDFHVESKQEYSIKLKENSFEIIMFLNLPDDYPDPGIPTFYLQAPSLTRLQKQEIALALNDVYLDHIRQPVVYDWVEKLREILQSFVDEIPEENTVIEKPLVSSKVKNDNDQFNIEHGPIIHDRKSYFQGHVAEVHFENQIKKVLDHLMTNRKIAEATHNILTYRIKLDNGGILQDYDDDGETNAGRRLLHLLEILDLTNVLVIVSRWYGGIHLGPDRFKHINNAARQVLLQTGYIEKKKS